jgi:hypothetical protein
MMRSVWNLGIVLVMLAAAGGNADDSYRLLPLENGGPPPQGMMNRYLIGQVDAAYRSGRTITSSARPRTRSPRIKSV